MLEVRLVCAATWLLLALALHTGAPVRARRAAWTWCGLAALADVSRWHVHLWRAFREGLETVGLYAARAWWKGGLAVALTVAALWLLPRLLRAAGDSVRVRFALLAAAGWTGWLLAWTAFLDDVLPPVFGEPVVRFGIELAWALLPLLALVRRRSS